MRVIKKRKKWVLGIALSLAVIGTFFAYLIKPSDVTLATEIKLRTYESLNDQAGDIQTTGDLRDVDKVREWAMQIVTKAFHDEKIKISQSEYDQISDAIIRTIKATIDAGNVEFDKSGKLTDLSKSYISNAVANAISYAVPTVDLNASVDSGTTQYEQVLNMQKTLKSLEKSNEELSQSVENLNNIYSFLKKFTGKDTSVDESRLEEKADALYSLLLAQSNENKSTGKPVASNTDAKIGKTVADLTQTQSTMLSDLQTAMSDIQKITDEIASLKEVDKDTLDEIERLKLSISSIQGTIETTKTQFSELIQKTEDTLRAEAAADKKELSGSISDTKTSLELSISNNYQKIETAMNTAISKIEKDAGSSNEKITQTINDAKANLEKQIEKSKSETEKLLEDRIKELTEADQSNKEELQEKISTVKQEITDEMEKNNETLREQMNTSFDNLDKKLDKLDQSLHSAIQDAKDELNASLEEKATEFEKDIAELTQSITSINEELDALTDKYDKAIEKLWEQVNANTTAIEALQERVNSYMAAADAHSKIDVISGFVIEPSDWNTDGDTASYVVQNEYFKSCVLAEVDYKQQYDISPTYTIDTDEGSLMITIPADQVSTIEVADIVCYHNSTDISESESKSDEQTTDGTNTGTENSSVNSNSNDEIDNSKLSNDTEDTEKLPVEQEMGDDLADSTQKPQEDE